MIGYAATETTTRARVRRWLPGAGDASVDFLWVLLALTLVRGVIYAVLNPPFSSPDEGDHFKYVAYLATGGASGDKGREFYQPPLYYALMVPAYLVTMGHSAATQLLAIRLLSSLFLIGIVLVAWKTSRTIAPDRPVLAIGVTSIVALSPENTVIAASANNDAAANLVGAVLTFLSSVLVLRPDRRKAAAALLAIAAALTTKITLFGMAGVCAAVLGAYLLKHARRVNRFEALGLSAFAIAAISVPLQTEGGKLTLNRIGVLLASLDDWQQSLGQVLAAGRWPWVYQFKTFWATFVGDTAQPAVGWYIILALIVALSVLGHLMRLRDHHLGHRAPTEGLPGNLFAVFFVGVLLQWMISASHLVVLAPDSIGAIWFRSEWSVQGRYLLQALVPFSILVVDGLLRLVPRHTRHWVAVAVPGFALAFDVSSMMSLATYYTWAPQFTW